MHLPAPAAAADAVAAADTDDKKTRPGAKGHVRGSGEPHAKERERLAALFLPRCQSGGVRLFVLDSVCPSEKLAAFKAIWEAIATVVVRLPSALAAGLSRADVLQQGKKMASSDNRTLVALQAWRPRHEYEQRALYHLPVCV